MGKLQLLRNGRGRERWKKWLVKEERNPEGNDLASKSFLKVGSGHRVKCCRDEMGESNGETSILLFLCHNAFKSGSALFETF